MSSLVAVDDLSTRSYGIEEKNSLCRILSFPGFPTTIRFLNHAELESFFQVRNKHCEEIWRRQQLLQNEVEIFRRYKLHPNLVGA